MRAVLGCDLKRGFFEGGYIFFRWGFLGSKSGGFYSLLVEVFYIVSFFWIWFLFVFMFFI